jgi:hypothetical protein
VLLWLLRPLDRLLVYLAFNFFLFLLLKFHIFRLDLRVALHFAPRIRFGAAGIAAIE